MGNGSDATAELIAGIQKLSVTVSVMSERLDSLDKKFDRAAHVDGFHRCARHSERIAKAEDSLELAHDRVSKTRRWVYGVIIGVSAFFMTRIAAILVDKLE